MRKCPPGVFCVENMTIIMCMFLVLFVGFVVMRTSNTMPSRAPMQRRHHNDNDYGYGYGYGYEYERPPVQQVRHMAPFLMQAMQPFPQEDVLQDPYMPPLKDERYLVPVPGSRVTPINISTNVGAVNTSYRQVGLLTPMDGHSPKYKNKHNDENVSQHKVNILPLMGRPVFVSRDKWQYYTMSDQKNSVKLPIVRNGRSGTSENGVDQLYEGDKVHVQGYNQAFRVTIYDNDTIQYIPYL